MTKKPATEIRNNPNMIVRILRADTFEKKEEGTKKRSIAVIIRILNILTPKIIP